VGGMRKRFLCFRVFRQWGSRLHEPWILLLSLLYHHWLCPLRFGGALAAALDSGWNCRSLNNGIYR
jgi:hypothetical protein